MNDTNHSSATVFIVDDDEAMRESLTWLIESVGLNVETFESADSFLASDVSGRPGCLLLDVRMPGMGGLELQDYMRQQGIHLPVIMITGHGDVPMAVRSMKAGAVDFIEKPFNDEQLLESIRNALSIDQNQRDRDEKNAAILQRLEQLTPREREVMDQVTKGMSNKEIANTLGVSAKTVEAHRARVMEKMEATSLAELVRLSVTATTLDA